MWTISVCWKKHVPTWSRKDWSSTTLVSKPISFARIYRKPIHHGWPDCRNNGTPINNKCAIRNQPNHARARRHRQRKTRTPRKSQQHPCRNIRRHRPRPSIWPPWPRLNVYWTNEWRRSRSCQRIKWMMCLSQVSTKRNVLVQQPTVKYVHRTITMERRAHTIACIVRKRSLAVRLRFNILWPMDWS